MTIVGARILVDNYKYPDGVNQEMQKGICKSNILDKFYWKQKAISSLAVGTLTLVGEIIRIFIGTKRYLLDV